jgi:hypothetical protein
MTNPFRKTAAAAFENQTRYPVIIDGEVVVPRRESMGFEPWPWAGALSA